MNPLAALKEGVLDLILPRHCAVSGRPLLGDEEGPVAPEVLREVEVAGTDYCSRCGAPQGAGVGVIGECLSCREYRDGFGTKEVVAVGKYEGVLKEMCLALKFGAERRIARPLAAWLAQLCFDRGIVDKVDAVVPMPLHIIRRFERGYNQAGLIAAELAGLIGKPLSPALKRAGATKRQARLSPGQRRSNVEAVFEAQAIKGGVLLVDDVMTTGYTLAAASRTLKRAGARPVYAAIAARASLDQDI